LVHASILAASTAWFRTLHVAADAAAPINTIAQNPEIHAVALLLPFMTGCDSCMSYGRPHSAHLGFTFSAMV
jgi:hypothetical protein